MGFHLFAIKNRFRVFVISVAVRIAEPRTILLWVVHHPPFCCFGYIISGGHFFTF